MYTVRKLSVGFCPVCQKPVAELTEVCFTGTIDRVRVSGIKAHNLVLKLKNQIDYSVRECNFLKFKSKPYGWKYGLNKSVKIKGKEYVRQYAKDFYGNIELIKIS